MFHPLPLFVGLRYVRTRRQGFFVSFISWVSMLGVCLGVAALITIVSVMNGFEGELRGRLVALTSHASVTAPAARMEDWQAVAGRALAVPGTQGAAPYVAFLSQLGSGFHRCCIGCFHCWWLGGGQWSTLCLVLQLLSFRFLLGLQTRYFPLHYFRHLDSLAFGQSSPTAGLD